MEIQQKRLSRKHTFTFNDQLLNFSFEERSGSADFDVAYGDIPKKSAIQLEENTWLRNVGYLWCVLGVIGLIISSNTTIWLVLGLGCLAWNYTFKIKHTVIKTNQGEIWIMHDKKHDEILREISDRRKQQLLQLFGAININNDPQKEINKFMWLLEQEVISKEEADAKIAQLQILQQQSSLPKSEGRLLN